MAKNHAGFGGSGEPFFYRERKSGEQYLKEVQLYVVAAMPPPPRGGDTMRVEEDHQEAAAAVMNPELEPELEQYFPEEDTVRVQDLWRQLWAYHKDEDDEREGVTMDEFENSQVCIPELAGDITENMRREQADC